MVGWQRTVAPQHAGSLGGQVMQEKVSYPVEIQVGAGGIREPGDPLGQELGVEVQGEKLPVARKLRLRTQAADTQAEGTRSYLSPWKPRSTSASGGSCCQARRRVSPDCTSGEPSGSDPHAFNAACLRRMAHREHPWAKK